MEKERVNDDRASDHFTLTGDHLDFDRFAIIGGELGIKGRGDVYLDGRLDLHVEARPWNRVLSRAGPVGDLLGEILGEVITHRVTSTLQILEVEAHPFDIGLDQEGR